ncbi:Hypothetical predicted protein [Cloeon dipterum]|uniref:Uncharacterized protein n=1 Tax=Cloeon dipterum TaxID=197152 RepID=A0A8S1DXK7_9INSE|nr:Hypothetical predicted protein [Cloeon dipterum]
MDDGTKLLVTQRRLLNLGRNKSLLELSMQKIVKNIKWFLEESDHKEKLTKLPSLLREKILDKVTGRMFVDIDEEENDMFSRIKAFELLLCPQIKEIKIKGLIVVYPCIFDKIIKIITTRAPNIISLTIVPPPERPNQDYPKPHEFPVSITEIGKLGKLRKLVVRSIMVDYQQLKEMCGNELRNLRYIDVCLNFDSGTNFEDVEDFKESFSNLQYFLFDAFKRGFRISLKNHDQMLWKMCIKHLPNLIAVEKIVQYDLDMYFEDRRISEISSEVSALQHLRLIPGTVELHRTFPRMNHLKICFDGHENEIKIETLLRFQNMKSLFLIYVNSLETVNKFIRCYGPKLETLYVEASADTHDIQLKFKNLFKSCPRLETLVLIYVDVIDDREPLNFFSKLKNLTWYPIRERSVFLSNVIQAPDLREVNFQFDSFDLDDLRKVSDLIARKAVLGKLQSLCASNFDIFHPNFHMENQSLISSFKALSEIIKNASAFLPDFIKFDHEFVISCTDLDINEQPLNSDSRFIDNELAATVRMIDANLVDFLIALEKYLYFN